MKRIILAGALALFIATPSLAAECPGGMPTESLFFARVAQKQSVDIYRFNEKDNATLVAAYRALPNRRGTVLPLDAVFLFAGEAVAQVACTTHDLMVKMLADKYQEQSVGGGTTINTQHIVEVYASATGTFSVMITSPQGLACLLAAGKGWQFTVPGTPL